MAIDKEKKSNRLLASRRYTHESFTDAQESFTEVLDLGASEVYTQTHKITSSGLPFSGSSQQGQFHVVGGDNISRYYYRHKLTKSNLNNEVWFFLNPSGSDSGIGAQLIDSNQQTSFISPKYSVSALANANAEDDTPGYLAKVFISSAEHSSSVSDSDVISVNNYSFDYKTGVVQFTDGTVDPSNSQYVYMSVYQYVGKTLEEGIELSGDISGSATSTGSFGRVEVAGDSSFTGNVTIGGNIQIGDADSDSLTISADLTSNLIPNVDSTFDLGSSTKYWRDQYVDSITATGNISSSLVSTASIAHLHVANNIGVGTQSPLATVHISASDGLIIPVGNTSQRSSNAIKGEIRFNDQIQSYEGYDGSNWGTLGGMNDVDQDTKITAENSAGADNDELKFFTAGSERLKITADGHISASGNITASGHLEIKGNISGSLLGSFSTLRVTDMSVSNISTVSSSISTRITQATASIDAITSSISALKVDSGSFSTRITQATASIDAITSSIDALKVDSASISLKMTQATASIHAITSSISALKTDSGSFSLRIDTESGSFSTRITQATSSIHAITSSISALKTDSGSLSLRITQATASIDAITSSIDALKVDSGSFSSRTTFLEGDGEIQSLGTTNNVLFSSITGSDDALFQRDVVVQGKLTAQEIHTEIESASIIFTSGSTKFGDTSDDTHEFTGSILVEGDVTAINLVADSSSLETRITQATASIDALKVDSGSLSLRITQATASIEAITSSIDALVIDSGSLSLRITQATASIDAITSSIDALKVDSGSMSLRMTQATASIEAITSSIESLIEDSGSISLRMTQATASIDAITSSIDALKVDSGSFSTRITADSSSFSTRITTDSSSFSTRITADSSSFSTRITTDSSSFSTRVTTEEINVDKLQTTASALINNFTQVQSLGKTDNVLFSSITASDDVKFQSNLVVDGKVTAQEFHTEVVSSSIIFTSGSTIFGDTIDDKHEFTGSFSVSDTSNLAGNVLMRSELNLLGNITASGNISASGDLFLTGNVDVNGTSNFAGNMVLQNNLSVQNNITASNNLSIEQTGSFGAIKERGLHLGQLFTRSAKGVFELDEDGNAMPRADLNALDYIIDKDFELDDNDDIIPRPSALWGYIDVD